MTNTSLTDFLAQFITEERLQRFDDVLQNRTRRLTVVLENIHHAHNASACLRTCDCLGIQDVHVVEAFNSFEPNQEIALGASQWLTIRRFRDEDEVHDQQASASERCLTELKEKGYRVLATSPRQESRPLYDFSGDQPTAVVFGAEQLGVSDLAMDMADDLVHIPMYGFTESFNISVSVALVIQHLLASARGTPDWRLSEAEQLELKDRWIKATLGPKLDPLVRRFQADFASET